MSGIRRHLREAERDYEPFETCPPCRGYWARRSPVVLPAIAAHCNDTGESAGAALHRFHAGVHDRHTRGLPLYE